MFLLRCDTIVSNDSVDFLGGFIMEKDMTKGNPMRLILGFAVPLLFGLVFQQFYSMVDAVIVGHYLGVDSLAAVGATGSVNFLIIGFCMGVCRSEEHTSELQSR